MTPWIKPFPAWLSPATAAPVAACLYFFGRHYSLAYLAGGILILAAFFLLLFRWDRARNWPLGTPLLILAGLALPALGVWQFLQLGDVGDPDHSSYSQALWNFRHGSTDFDLHGRNIFGIHSMYTAVLWIPVHWLGGELGLKIGNGLCLLGAVLLLARPWGPDREGADWAALAVLLSPPVASQFFFGFHPEMLGAPVLVLALAAYRDGKLGRFLACVAFLAYTKETLTLAVAGILLLALVERRSWKWVLLPGFLCCALMAVYWFAVLPRFAPEGNHLGYFMPSSPREVLANWWRLQNLRYALHIFLPFLPLLWALPRRYLLLPLPLMFFYSAFPDPLFVQMWPNYAFPLPFLCAAGLILEGRKARDSRLLLACTVISVLSYPLWREILTVPTGNLARAREVDRIRSLIPETASVMVNGPFHARFGARKAFAFWGQRDRKQSLREWDYLVLDGKFAPAWLTDREDLARSIDSLSASPDWSREYGRDSLYLFRNLRGPP